MIRIVVIVLRIGFRFSSCLVVLILIYIINRVVEIKGLLSQLIHQLFKEIIRRSHIKIVGGKGARSHVLLARPSLDLFSSTRQQISQELNVFSLDIGFLSLHHAQILLSA